MRSFLNYSKNRFLYGLLKLVIAFFLAYLGFSYFNCMQVHAASSYEQIFSTDENGTLVILDGLMTYDISQGSKFTYYQFKFTNTDLEKGKTYHVVIYLYGTLGDGYYSFNPDFWEFSSYDSVNNKVDKLNTYDLKMTGTGEYRTIEFDFYNATDYRIYRLSSANSSGMLYYQYSGSGRFGWYSFDIQKINDSDDVIINQNDQIINEQKETNEKLDDLNEKQEESNKTQEEIKDAITDETPPNLSGLQDSAGWLPAGPVDSILNLPFSLLNNLVDNLGGTCQPANLTIPFINKNYTLPCMSEVYEEIGISSWITGIGTIASAFIAYYYLLNLYAWVDMKLTFRENHPSAGEQWGGI